MLPRHKLPLMLPLPLPAAPVPEQSGAVASCNSWSNSLPLAAGGSLRVTATKRSWQAQTGIHSNQARLALGRRAWQANCARQAAARAWVSPHSLKQ